MSYSELARVSMVGRWPGSGVKQVSKDSRRVHPINRKSSSQITREEIVREFQEQDRQDLERTRLKLESSALGTRHSHHATVASHRQYDGQASNQANEFHSVDLVFREVNISRLQRC